MKDLIIIGAGGYGREVLEMALDIQESNLAIAWRVKGFLTDIVGDFYEKDNLGYDILDRITDYKVKENEVYAFAIANIPFKMKITKEFLEQGAEFVNLIHPSAVIGRTVRLGIGNIIASRVTITNNVELGDFIRIGGGTSIGHDVHIGNYAVISGTCGVNGYAVLGEGSFLGSHAVICPHAKVGDFSTVGAGSVVLKKVKPNTTVFGVPAKRIN